MSAAAKPVHAIGFLTVVEHAEFGIFGGYLLLNAAARPLEFHCTAPVKANRAQEILYGPTLKEYLYEQIAPALLSKAKTTPFLICTDSAVMLAAAAASAVPLALVFAGLDDDASGRVTMTLGQNRLALPVERAREQSAIADRWREAHADSIDLCEPFARIREALEEAQRAVRPAA
jgi:hypothetical protein